MKTGTTTLVGGEEYEMEGRRGDSKDKGFEGGGTKESLQEACRVHAEEGKREGCEVGGGSGVRSHQILSCKSLTNSLSG